MLEHAVIPVDIHRRFDDTMAMAAFLEYFTTRRVCLVHIDSGRDRNKTTRILDDRRQQLAGLGLQTELVLRRGHIATAVVEAASAVGGDFICIPWKRKGMLKRSLLGSTTMDIIRMSDIPVFVFKKPGLAHDGSRLNRVLYATGFAKTDSRVVPYLTSSGLKAEHLTLLHVGQRAPDPVAEQERLARVNKNLDRLANECAPFFSSITSKEVIGTPRRQIVLQARILKTDLIVVGTFDSSDSLDQVLGSTAQAITYSTPCPVLTVPGIKTPGDAG